MLNYQSPEYVEDLRDIVMSPTATVYFRFHSGRRDSMRDHITVEVADICERDGERRAHVTDVSYRLAQTFPRHFTLGRRGTANERRIIRDGCGYSKSFGVAYSLAQCLGIPLESIPSHWSY